MQKFKDAKFAILTVAFIATGAFTGDLFSDLRDQHLTCLFNRFNGCNPLAASEALARTITFLVGVIVLGVLVIWLKKSYRESLEVYSFGRALAKTPMDVLVLPVSLPFRNETAYTAGQKATMLQDVCNGLADTSDPLRIVARIGDRDIKIGELSLAHMCSDDFVWTAGTTAFRFEHFAWQQTLRILRQILEMPMRNRLSSIYVIPTEGDANSGDRSYSSGYEKDFMSFVACALRMGNRPDVTLSARVLKGDTVDDAKDLLQSICNEVHNRNARAHIALDITGGTRIYAAAAVMVAIGKRIYFIYSKPDHTVEPYDIRAPSYSTD